MQVFYSPYELTPKKSANRLSGVEKKRGVFLKIRARLTNHFADFFPHVELGNETLEHFLDHFKFQETEYQKKVFHLLLQEEELRSQKLRSFLNHELWDGVTIPRSSVVKYKLQHSEDFSFLKLNSTTKIRLDANGCFNEISWKNFLKNIPESFLSQLEYIEDPMTAPSWPKSPIPWAEDFLSWSEAKFKIHKPNARFINPNKTNIFSSYLGSDLGMWHAYLELLKEGDLSLYHGVTTRGFYEEERGIFDSNNHPQLDVLKSFYLELENLNWKSLCSI